MRNAFDMELDLSYLNYKINQLLPFPVAGRFVFFRVQAHNITYMLISCDAKTSYETIFVSWPLLK